MDIKCPHCGTEYEVERKDMYRYTKCDVCGKGFVIGASMKSSKNGGADATEPDKTTDSHGNNRDVKCPHCGAEFNKGDAEFGQFINCERCGRGFLVGQRPRAQTAQANTLKKNTPQSTNTMFTNPCKSDYWSFEGRSTRAEYWSTMLVLILVFFAFVFLPIVWIEYDVIESAFGISLGIALAVVVGVFTIIAQLPITVRRLHDVNLSGWWLLLRLAESTPFIGWCFSIVDFIVLGCLDGTKGLNKYGPDPKGRLSDPIPNRKCATQIMPQAPQQPTQQQIIVTQNQTNGESGDVISKIKRLAELKNLGLLTEAEYESKKEQLLSQL